MPDELHHFIGGERVAGSSGRASDVFDPAAGEVSATCPYASATEVAAAVAVATEARRARRAAGRTSA